MKSDKQRVLAYALTAIFLVVGVVCYAAFPAKNPDPPVRLLFPLGPAGDVLFDHHEHVDSYGINCDDCHHTGDMDTRQAVSCLDCHDDDEPYNDKANFVHQEHITDFDLGCSDCHTETLPEDQVVRDCGACHKKKATPFAMKRDDAFHQQCKGCHEEMSGPTDCNTCHMLAR